MIRTSLASDLYRLLGRGAAETSAETFAAMWSSLGGRLPDDPFGGARLAGPTVVAERGIFRDVRNPPVVYVLDASSSMKNRVRLSRPLIEDLKRTEIPLEDQGDGLFRKVDIVRADLASTLEGFSDGVPFRIVVFNDRAVSHSPEIVALSMDARRSALEFLRAIQVRRGTDISRGLSEAFETPAMASLCLLFDGKPSRGLEREAIDRQVFRWNYLHGVRIIALSFARDVGDDDNLCSVLARRNFGWVRVLDLTEPAPEDRVDPLAHEELPGPPFGRRSLRHPTSWRWSR